MAWRRLSEVRSRVQPLATAKPDAPEYTATLARIDAASGLLYERAGNIDKADTSLRNAIKLTGEGLNPTLVATRTSLRERLATMLETRGRHADAMAMLDLGLKDLRALAAELPSNLNHWLTPQFIRLAEAFRGLGEDESASALDPDIETLIQNEGRRGPRRDRGPGPRFERRPPPPPRQFDDESGGPPL